MNKFKRHYKEEFSFSGVDYVLEHYDGVLVDDSSSLRYDQDGIIDFFKQNATALQYDYINGILNSAYYLYKNNVIHLYFPYEETKKKIKRFGLRIDRTDLYESVIPELEQFAIPSSKGSRVYFLMQNKNGFYISEGAELEEIINIDSLYNKEFTETNKDIVKKLNNSKAGLYMFSGIPGTGKTTFLKYLTQQVSDREFIYIPSSLAGAMDDPSLLDTLQDHKNAILIVEDAEDIIKDRNKSRNASTVSTVLNITDGLIGASLGLSIILTFNCDDSEIDSALLRKGRLLAKHHFEKLTVEEAKILATKHNLKGEITLPMTIAEVFNIDENNGHVEKKQNKMGF